MWRGIYIFLLSIFCMGNFLIASNKVVAAEQAIVIDAVFIQGETPTDEFILLYNTSMHDVALAGYELKKQTKSGREYVLDVDFIDSIDGALFEVTSNSIWIFDVENWIAFRTALDTLINGR